jgi:hypothetical protein
MPSTEGIPQDVLVHILQHVPLTERMSTCSLVQKCWKDAAAAATTSIALKGMTAARATAIAAQLANSSTFWAKHITRISLEQHAVSVGSLEVVLQLACPKLQQLHLSGFILTPAANTQSSSAGSGSADSQGLSLGCPLLQELSLTSCWVETAEAPSTQSQSALSLLTALPALTKLHLGAIKVSVAAPGGGNHRTPNLGPLSALAGLQELSLEKPKAWQLQGIFCRSNQQQLLPSLTKLSILTDPGVQYSTSTTPGLYELSSLRCLELRGAEVGSVQQLSALLHLESLVLHSTASLRVENHVSDSDSNSDGYNDYLWGRDDPCVADTGELLQLLPQLTRLTSLDVLGLADETLLAAAVPQWTCLGRCTGLQVLRLQNLFMHRDSWPLMFAGAQLNSLHELRLTMYDVEFHIDDSSVMPPNVVQQMVDACPKLKVLQLGGDVLLSNRYSPGNCMPEVRDCPPVSLAALAQLQHLTSLRVYSMRSQVCLWSACYTYLCLRYL